MRDDPHLAVAYVGEGRCDKSGSQTLPAVGRVHLGMEEVDVLVVRELIEGETSDWCPRQESNLRPFA